MLFLKSKYFCGLLRNVEKINSEKLNFVKKLLSYPFCGRMLKSKNLKMGTSSKAQFTLTVRTVSAYIAKANVLMDILFILLY